MARWTKMTWAGWSTMTFLAIGVAAYGIGGVVIGIEQMIPQMAYHLPDRATFAATHFAVGGLVLAIGPFQFLPAARARWPSVHRWIGRIYVAGCIFSGVAGLILASNTNAGPIAQTGFTLLAIYWLVSTTMAFLKARGRDFAEHRPAVPSTPSPARSARGSLMRAASGSGAGTGGVCVCALLF